MKYLRVASGIATLILLSACSNTRFAQNCSPMVGTERERCLQNNASSEQAVEERAKAKRADKTSPGDFGEDDLKNSRDK